MMCLSAFETTDFPLQCVRNGRFGVWRSGSDSDFEKAEDLWISKTVVISSSVTDSNQLTCTFNMIRCARVQYISVACLSGSSCKH